MTSTPVALGNGAFVSGSFNSNYTGSDAGNGGVDFSQREPWFQRALRSGEGRIRAGGVERDVTFEQPGPEVAEDLHAAYHAKYDRYGPRMVGTVVSPEAVRSTLGSCRASRRSS